MSIQLLLTGNELMAGHTVDSNSARIAQALDPLGYRLDRKVTVGDELSVLVAEIQQLSQQAEVLIINGGLGPTDDDLTATALAQAAGQTLQEHPEALAHLQRWCQRIGMPLSEENRKQALLPENANIIANPIGSAVGFSLTLNRCLILCTPGVPRELEAMLAADIPRLISQQLPASPRRLYRLQTFGLGESSLQAMLHQQFTDLPDAIEIGFRAGHPLLEVKLSAPESLAEANWQHWQQRLRTLIGDYLIGEEDQDLATAVVAALNKRNSQLSTAESCTGGQIAAQITAVPGASQVYEAGIVSYSNRIKQQILAVDAQLLNQYGAVSEPVVLAMAEGALQLSGADYVIAVSGIAGPDGGSEEKPVGTVWLAWGKAGQLKTRRLQIGGSRQFFQQRVSAMALDLIRRELLAITEPPRYFKRNRSGG